MKVLHVIGTLDPKLGGPMYGVLESARVWNRHGHSREIVTLDLPERPWVQISDIKVHALGSRIWVKRFFGVQMPWGRYEYTGKLIPWLRINASAYDAIIVNGLWHFASFGTWAALRRSNVKYFVFPHGMLDPWQRRDNYLKFFFKKLYWRFLERRVIEDATCIFFTCEEEKVLAEATWAPWAGRSAVVGYGSADLKGQPGDRASLNRMFPSVRTRRLVLYMGRIHRKKGIEILLKAFARACRQAEEFDLAIAGPLGGSYFEHMVRLARLLGIENRVHWLGMLTGSTKVAALNACEWLVLPSHQENFGIVIAEALSVGKPVIITNKVNIWREVIADQAGLVVNDDEDDLEKALLSAFSTEPADQAILKAAARRSFEKRFNLEKNSMDLLHTIRNLSNPVQKS